MEFEVTIIQGILILFAVLLLLGLFYIILSLILEKHNQGGENT